MCYECNVETVQNQLDWLYLKMPDTPTTKFKVSEYLRPNGCLCKSTRVWTKVAIYDESENKFSVAPGVGGTIVFEDIDETLVVRWDNSLITMHQRGAFLDQIIRIGQCATISQYYLEQHQAPKPS